MIPNPCSIPNKYDTTTSGSVLSVKVEMIMDVTRVTNIEFCFCCVFSLGRFTRNMEKISHCLRQCRLVISWQTKRNVSNSANENITSPSISVRRWRSVQGGTERVPDPGAGRGWLLRRGGARHADAVGDHHHGHQDTECAGRERPQNPRAHIGSAEEVQHPRAVGGAVRREGRHPRPVRHRASWIFEIQTYWRLVSWPSAKSSICDVFKKKCCKVFQSCLSEISLFHLL